MEFRCGHCKRSMRTLPPGHAWVPWWCLHTTAVRQKPICRNVRNGCISIANPIGILKSALKTFELTPADPPRARSGLAPPGRKDLYIDVWRGMGALLHKCREAEANQSKRQRMLYIISESYWNSDVVTVNVRFVHCRLAMHGRPGGASTQLP